MSRHAFIIGLFLILSMTIFSYGLTIAQSQLLDIVVSGEDAKFSFAPQSSTEFQRIAHTSSWSINESSADMDMIHRLSLLIPMEVLAILPPSPQVAKEESSAIFTFSAISVTDRLMHPDRVHISGADSAKGFGLVPIN